MMWTLLQDWIRDGYSNSIMCLGKEARLILKTASIWTRFRRDCPLFRKDGKNALKILILKVLFFVLLIQTTAPLLKLFGEKTETSDGFDPVLRLG